MTDNTSSANERTSRLKAWWTSRAGGPFIAELAIASGLLLMYRGVRSFTRTDLSDAFRHARLVVELEHWLGAFIEDDIQSMLLHHPDLIRGLNHYYLWMHFPIAVGLLLWAYCRHPQKYSVVRTEMALLTFAALVLHVVFPLAPPRMMPGFVDTMMRFGPSIYPRSALEGTANQIAAMPSLHFGWALLAALWFLRLTAGRLRTLVLVHPAVMLLAIIATANHWWIDAAAAALLTAAVRQYSRFDQLLSRRRQPSAAQY
ncbi:phosphatase PAP2 family protein [Ilumatobacteraceae bacterium]|jgi:hypothetical protein|nr:phosphatase PAP2 family protein [Ilumatobacteraceae bacterium]